MELGFVCGLIWGDFKINKKGGFYFTNELSFFFFFFSFSSSSSSLSRLEEPSATLIFSATLAFFFLRPTTNLLDTIKWHTKQTLNRVCYSIIYSTHMHLNRSWPSTPQQGQPHTTLRVSTMAKVFHDFLHLMQSMHTTFNTSVYQVFLKSFPKSFSCNAKKAFQKTYLNSEKLFLFLPLWMLSRSHNPIGWGSYWV